MNEVKTPVATGGCQCGKVRYALHVTPEKAHACHCRMCQRAVGGAFALLVGVPKTEFEWTAGEPGVFESSSVAKRHFCRDCGTPLSFTYNLPEARFYVTIGSLDHPERTPIERHFGVESRLGWVKFCDGVPEEVTGQSPAAAEFLARMENNQAKEGG